jgi:hypothetical protein
MADYIKGKDYLVLTKLAKYQQEPFRKWLVDNNKSTPYIPEEGEDANQCFFCDDYREWLLIKWNETH